MENSVRCKSERYRIHRSVNIDGTCGRIADANGTVQIDLQNVFVILFLFFVSD